MLLIDIKKEIVSAMKEKDQLKLNTLRSIVTACTNYLVANGKMPSDEIMDDEVLDVIKKLYKQRKDALKQYTDLGEKERADVEEQEAKLLEKYLPEQMGEDEIRKIVENIKTSKSIDNKGELMKESMKELKGKADGGTVSKIVNDVI